MKFAFRDSLPPLKENLMGSQFAVVEIVSGRTEAETLRAFLQAHGITCELSQEAA
jgi:hypothetical protein